MLIRGKGPELSMGRVEMLFDLSHWLDGAWDPSLIPMMHGNDS